MHGGSTGMTGRDCELSTRHCIPIFARARRVDCNCGALTPCRFQTPCASWYDNPFGYADICAAASAKLRDYSHNKADISYLVCSMAGLRQDEGAIRQHRRPTRQHLRQLQCIFGEQRLRVHGGGDYALLDVVRYECFERVARAFVAVGDGIAIHDFGSC